MLRKQSDCFSNIRDCLRSLSAVSWPIERRMIQQFIAISDGKVAGSWLDFVRARKLFTRSPNILKKKCFPLHEIASARH